MIRTPEEEASIRRRLCYARWLYEKGLEQAAHEDELSGMLSITHFHNAVELVLQQLVLVNRWKSINQLRTLTYEALVQTVDNQGTGSRVSPGVPHRDLIMRLNESRNQIMHHGTRYHISEVEEARKACRLFLVDAVKQFLSMDIDTVSLADLIANIWARKMMQEAEAQKSVQDYVTSVYSSATVIYRVQIALRKGVMPQHTWLHHRLGGFPTGNSYNAGHSDNSELARRVKAVEETLKKVPESLRAIKDEFDVIQDQILRASLLSIMGPIAAHYFEFAPHISQTLSGGPEAPSKFFMQMPQGVEYGLAEAEKSLRFALSAVLKIESYGLGDHITPN